MKSRIPNPNFAREYLSSRELRELGLDKELEVYERRAKAKLEREARRKDQE
jgi:hypothetical protein